MDRLEFRSQLLVGMPQPPSPSSEKLVTGAADSAPAEPDVSYLEESPDTASSKESITAGSGTDSHNTGSDSVSTCGCEKHVAGAAESAYEQTLQDPNVASSKELLDTTSLRKSRRRRENADIDQVFAELMADFSLEELITTSQQKMSHNTTDGSQQPASSAGYKILIRFSRNCYQRFYIRKDRTGYFCTYPDVDGPFHSIHEANIAINHFIDELWPEERCDKEDRSSHGDRMMHRKYYLYVTRMKHPSSPSSETLYDEKYLIQALLDYYNAGNSLFGDLAHQLKDLVKKKIIIENPWLYYHLNFTTKQHANDSAGDKLFFAELSCTLGENIWRVSCCCIIETQDDDGGHCYVCRRKSNGIHHPKNTDAYVGGHVDSGPSIINSNYEEEDNNDVDIYVDEDEDDMDEDNDVEDEPDNDDEEDEDDDSDEDSSGQGLCDD